MESGLKTGVAPETVEDLTEALAQQQSAVAKHERAQAVGVPVIAPDITHNVYKDEIDVVKQRSDFQHQNNVLTVALEKKIKQKQEDAARQEEELIEQQRLAMTALAAKKAGFTLVSSCLPFLSPFTYSESVASSRMSVL